MEASVGYEETETTCSMQRSGIAGGGS